jgi:cardiolipin synthase
MSDPTEKQTNMTPDPPSSIHSSPLSREAASPGRQLAEQAFSRAAGAPLTTGNHIRLLKDAKENYPAWLDAIRKAKRTVYFESYIISEDDVGLEFADALIAKAREGARVRLIYDWMGGWGRASRSFWSRLREGGVDVRCFNPPRPDSPLGWVSRDHRKMVAVDGEVGFVTGLCVGKPWVGDPKRGIDPWRDTGVEVRGPAVADIEKAFAHVWEMTGAPIPEGEMAAGGAAPAGETALRVVASVPNSALMFRLDQLIAVLARRRLWLTDAYYCGVTLYVQSLKAAAKDGVDVRLLVPGASDIPILRPLTRSGYRALLEAGVRVFEWNGPMLHAKTAVADGRWARVGSTNLNVASWLGNCELDVVVEDGRFAQAMEAMYLDDLANATEVVLDEKRRLKPPAAARHPRMTSGGGSAGRAAAGMLRIGNAVGAAFTNHRVLEPVEMQLMMGAGALLLALSLLAILVPRFIVYPIAAVGIWLGASLLIKGYQLRSKQKSTRTRP